MTLYFTFEMILLVSNDKDIDTLYEYDVIFTIFHTQLVKILYFSKIPPILYNE